MPLSGARNKIIQKSSAENSTEKQETLRCNVPFLTVFNLKRSQKGRYAHRNPCPTALQKVVFCIAKSRLSHHGEQQNGAHLTVKPP